jgi:hypothetical protein
MAVRRRPAIIAYDLGLHEMTVQTFGRRWPCTNARSPRGSSASRTGRWRTATAPFARPNSRAPTFDSELHGSYTAAPNVTGSTTTSASLPSKITGAGCVDHHETRTARRPHDRHRFRCAFCEAMVVVRLWVFERWRLGKYLSAAPKSEAPWAGQRISGGLKKTRAQPRHKFHVA